MYIVNTSFFVNPQAQERWLDILNNKYIPFLKENGFSETVFCRVLSEDTPENFTYSLMVHIDDMGQYSRLTGEIFDEYKTIAVPLFGEDVVWFTTVMKKLSPEK